MTVCRRIEEVPKGWSATVADVDGIPSPPEPHARGKCLGCGAAMVSKTGRVRSHWAHAVSKDWDPWWETETPWHRAWKARFPENWREIAETATDGEIHRADVRTPNGLVLEFQHSSLRDDELASRNAFYPNLVWVLDGLTFKQNFEVCHALPHPTSSIAEDIAWEPAVWGMHGAMGGMYFKVSEYTRDYGKPASKAQVRCGFIHGYHRITAEVAAAHRGHYQYVWKRPRAQWAKSTAPVFIDFGDGLLWKLGVYEDGSGLACCRVTSVARFVAVAQFAASVADLEAALWGE